MRFLRQAHAQGLDRHDQGRVHCPGQKMSDGHGWQARGVRANGVCKGGAPSGVQGQSPLSGGQGIKPGKSGVDMSTPCSPPRGDDPGHDNSNETNKSSKSFEKSASLVGG